MIIYLSRDKNGTLKGWLVRPRRVKKHWEDVDGREAAFIINKNLFEYITWDDEPVMYEIAEVKGTDLSLAECFAEVERDAKKLSQVSPIFLGEVNEPTATGGGDK